MKAVLAVLWSSCMGSKMSPLHILQWESIKVDDVLNSFFYIAFVVLEFSSLSSFIFSTFGDPAPITLAIYSRLTFDIDWRDYIQIWIFMNLEVFITLFLLFLPCRQLTSLFHILVSFNYLKIRDQLFHMFYVLQLTKKLIFYYCLCIFWGKIWAIL